MAHASIVQQSFLDELSLDTSRTADTNIRRSLRARAARRLQTWSPKCRSKQTLAIEEDEGVPYESSCAAADALQAYWGQRFSDAKGISNDDAEAFLEYVTHTDFASGPMTLAEFSEVLEAPPSSAPGLDGLVFLLELLWRGLRTNSLRLLSSACIW